MMDDTTAQRTLVLIVVIPVIQQVNSILYTPRVLGARRRQTEILEALLQNPFPNQKAGEIASAPGCYGYERDSHAVCALTLATCLQLVHVSSIILFVLVLMHTGAWSNGGYGDAQPWIQADLLAIHTLLRHSKSCNKRITTRRATNIETQFFKLRKRIRNKYE